MVLADIISDMNSNYENRKHGGNSLVFSMQEKMLSTFPEIGLENVFASEMYLPIGQKFEPGTLENLRMAVNEYSVQNVLSRDSRKLS